jgi:hypothetical protein
LTGLEGDVVHCGGDGYASAPCKVLLEGDVVAAMEML